MGAMRTHRTKLGCSFSSFHLPFLSQSVTSSGLWNQAPALRGLEAFDINCFGLNTGISRS